MGSSLELVDNTELVKKASEEAIERALEAIGLQAEGYAKLELENDPRRIDTGRLRNSITHQRQGKDTEVIGTNVEYAEYVHEGTRRMEPNRFLRNAVTKNIDEYKQILETELKKR